MMKKYVLFTVALCSTALSFSPQVFAKGLKAEAADTQSTSEANDNEKSEPIGRASSPPGHTDDPWIPDVGATETNVDYTCTKGAHSKICLVNIDSNIGVKIFGKAVQIKLEIPYVSNRTTDEDGNKKTLYGLGKMLLGVKVPVIGNEESKWSVSIYPQVETGVPFNNSAKRGVVDQGNHFIAPVIVAYKNDMITFLYNAEVDYFINPGADVTNPHRFGQSVAAGINITSKGSAMIEYGRSNALGKFKTDVETNKGIGGMYKATKRLNVYAMLERIKNPDGSFNEVHVGMQFTTEPNPANEKYYNWFPKKEAVHAVLLNPEK